MKTSKSPLRQIPGCSMFFGFLILFAHGALGKNTPSTATVGPSAAMASISDTLSNVTSPTDELPTPKLTKTGTDTNVSSEAHPVSTLLAVTSGRNEETTSVSMSSLERPSTPVHLELENISKQKEPATLEQTKQADTTAGLQASANRETATTDAAPPSKTEAAIVTKGKEPALEQIPTPKHSAPDTVTKRKEPATLEQTKQADTTAGTPASANLETATTVAAPPNKTEAAKGVGKSHTTEGEPASSDAAATTVRSIGLKPKSTKGEKDQSTPPGKHVPDTTTTRHTSSRGREIQYTTEPSTTKASDFDPGVEEDLEGSGGVNVTPTIKTHSDPRTTASPVKDSRAMTVAIVLSILLLMVLLIAIVCCWRRRRSGSTSFKMAGWAGQVALPDDSGLDKEVEQGVQTAGEGEARRATLTTFFGKRQSRVPSVAMEEVVRKETGDPEEAQNLIDGDVSGVSSLEGSGEANGKLPDPAVQCSQEKEFPPPPANQEETPPTKLE